MEKEYIGCARSEGEGGGDVDTLSPFTGCSQRDVVLCLVMYNNVSWGCVEARRWCSFGVCACVWNAVEVGGKKTH